MLGWDPHLYYPHGRASCELLALDGVELGDRDLGFRANLVTMKGCRLESYNGHLIRSEQAIPLVEKIKAATADRFPNFELYHNSDFRNSLVIRGVGVDPRAFVCPEPHENEGVELDIECLVGASEARAAELARLVNRYVACARQVLEGEPANLLFPWSASSRLALPSFADTTGFEGKVGIVGCMDFLHGIARAGGIDFCTAGNGRPDTDYAGKGAMMLDLLDDGYEFVICHINAPDEASHMGQWDLKVDCLEQIDRHIVQPLVARMSRCGDEFGGIMIAPDHYTNYDVRGGAGARGLAHSLDPVPFAFWNGRDRDQVEQYGEDAARHGRYGGCPVNHLELMHILGVARLPPRPRGSAGD
jgi:2,3-bisphosphoglycerate-independent phosphoglycerate mutase